MTWQPPRAPRGTTDILPDEAARWRRVEETARTAAERYGYREMRTPLFEATELYVRGMGEATDVVEKEMFTVGGPAKAEGERESFSLRPEFTAGIVRAYREHGLDKTQGFLKVYSIGPLFRYERPQKGRQRQFHQINVEALATTDPLADVEMIALAREMVSALGIPGFRVRLNSIGHEAPDCRGAYRELLKERLRPRLDTLCDNCKARFDRNVFRILDCKKDAEKTADMPPMADHLCAECTPHFAAVRGGLDRLHVAYAIDARLVRGFDYYTRTVFEFPSERLGAQDAIGGGGRYDRLIPDMGGPDVGACGFALGVERLLLAMAAGDTERQPAARTPERPRAVYIVATPEPAVRVEALALAMELRAAGVEADFDLEGKSVKAQMRAANRLGVRWVALLGGDELAAGTAVLKDMNAGDSQNQVGVKRENFLECVKGSVESGRLRV